MKRTLEICSSFTGKISTGNFENSAPFFSIKEVIEENDDIDLSGKRINPENMSDIAIKTRQQELQKMCVDQFNKVAEILYQEKVAKAYKQIRFYEGKEGLKYPSTTSIINMDTDFFMSQEDLYQYSCRGYCIHKAIEIFLKTGKVVLYKEIPEIAFEVMTVLTGSLNLSLEDVNFVGFFADYPVKIIELEKTIINDDEKYGGRLDILCQVDSKNPGKWGKVEGVEFDKDLVMDVKTGVLDKTKGFMQQASYCKPLGVTQTVLIPLNKDTVQGFSKPVFTNKIDSYFSMFLAMSKRFFNRFGV